MVIQLVLIVSVVLLTIIFVVAGVWVILILREVKNLLTKLKEVGDDLKETTGFAKEKLKESLGLASVLTIISALWSQKERIEELIFGQDKKEGQTKKELVRKAKDVSVNPVNKDHNNEDNKKKTSSNSEDFPKTKPRRRFFFRRKK